MAISEKSLKVSSYSNIGHGIFQAQSQIILFESSIYLSQFVVFRMINFFFMDSHVQTKNKKVEYLVNHQISQANPNTCKRLESLKLAFLTHVSYKIKPS
jgi:hypothetical protein